MGRDRRVGVISRNQLHCPWDSGLGAPLVPVQQPSAPKGTLQVTCSYGNDEITGRWEVKLLLEESWALKSPSPGSCSRITATIPDWRCTIQAWIFSSQLACLDLISYSYHQRFLNRSLKFFKQVPLSTENLTHVGVHSGAPSASASQKWTAFQKHPLLSPFTGSLWLGYGTLRQHFVLR